MPGDDDFPTPLDPRPVGRRTRRPAAEGSLRRGIADRVSAEPRRHRRPRAAAELAYRGGAARHNAERLPDPRRTGFGITPARAALGLPRGGGRGVPPAPGPGGAG